MKRRVSRAHSNKHELRVISAANNLPLERFQVVVDASFLRAILLSYWQEYESLYKTRSSGPDRRRPTPSSANAPQKHFISAYQYLRESVDEAFASSAVGRGAKAQTPRNGAHGKTSVFYFHVPETARTLRRLMAQSPTTNETNNSNIPHSQQGKGTPSPSHKDGRKGPGKQGKQFDTSRIPEEVTGDLLSRLQRRGAEDVVSTSGPRNEGKAIADLIVSGLRDSAAGGYYFVASQNHDVRKLLPSRTGILRWTRQPNGVWLEQNGKEGLHDDATAAVPLTSSSAASGGGGHHGGTAHQNATTGPRLSTADIAFMRHIGRGDHLVRASPRPTADANAAEPVPKADSSGRTVPSTSSTAAAAEPPKPRAKRKRVHGSNPNPLSMKKKQKKEVFRIN